MILIIILFQYNTIKHGGKKEKEDKEDKKEKEDKKDKKDKKEKEDKKESLKEILKEKEALKEEIKSLKEIKTLKEEIKSLKAKKKKEEDKDEEENIEEENIEEENIEEENSEEENIEEENIEEEINLEIKSITFTKHLLHDMLGIIHKRHQMDPNFKLITDEETSFYERQARILENKYKLDYESIKLQLFSIRKLEIMAFIYQCTGKVKKLSKEIKHDFENGFELTLIADRHKIPYIMALKQLFSEYGYSEREIKKILRKEKKVPDKMKAIESELDFILKSDPTSSINSLEGKKLATKFENSIAQFLNKNGVKYISEEEARNKNKKNDKNDDIFTPDFLLKDGQSVTINGFPISWIEVKNYAYYGNKILENGIQKQSKKYYNKYGNGVFIFRCGALENAGNNNVKFIGWHL